MQEAQNRFSLYKRYHAAVTDPYRQARKFRKLDSVNKHVPSASSVPGTILGTGNTKIQSLPSSNLQSTFVYNISRIMWQ